MIKLSRPLLFLIFTLLAFFAPLVIFGTSLTFIFVVPFTILVWFAAKWQDVAGIEERSSLLEKVLAVALYAGNIVRNVVGFSEGFQGIGLFDMFVAFVAACVAFYGFRGLKRFVLPTLYLGILIVGYQLEFSITQVSFLEKFLANVMVSVLNAFSITASATGNLVSLYSRGGNLYYLVIDAPCTGIKGMLAYGSLAVLMAVDVKTTNKQRVLWTVIGFVGTFFVNILRLLAIFLAAYFLEIDTALSIHTYLGYGLFIAWVFIFWTVAFKYMPIQAQAVPRKLQPSDAVSSQSK